MKASIAACLNVEAVWLLTASAPTSAAARRAKWSELMSANWNPRYQFELAGSKSVRHGSPPAMPILEQLRAALNNAPTKLTVEGKLLQLTGSLAGRVTNVLPGWNERRRDLVELCAVGLAPLLPLVLAAEGAYVIPIVPDGGRAVTGPGWRADRMSFVDDPSPKA